MNKKTRVPTDIPRAKVMRRESNFSDVQKWFMAGVTLGVAIGLAISTLL